MPVDKTDPALRLVPEYKGQPTVSHIIRAQTTPVTTTVTSGQVATNVTLSSANIVNFTTRFAGYDQFRIVKAVCKFNCSSSTCSGIMNVWFDEDTAAAPTNTTSLQSKVKSFNLSDVTKPHVYSYTPHDPAQQTWTDVNGGSPVIGYLKYYTDSVNYGSPTVATQCMVVEVAYTVQFRGFI